MLDISFFGVYSSGMRQGSWKKKNGQGTVCRGGPVYPEKRTKMKWRTLDLEISLKPFHSRDPRRHAEILEHLFRQWDPLIRETESVGILLFASDGSEILQYTGRMEDPFEWGKWVGVANPPEQSRPLTPEESFPWLKPRLYREDARTFTYGELHELVRLTGKVFRGLYGRKIRVGAMFDPGMEFAVSRFKYRDHHECCLGHNGRFVCCYLDLHGDRRCYAAFPDGIPEGLSFGSFFGAQLQRFLTDMEMDSVWFGNGFGFGSEAWGACGALFDGTKFMPERAPEVRKRILGF